MLRILGQRLRHHAVDGRRETRSSRGKVRRQVVLVCPQQRHVIVALEHGAARKGLIDDAGEVVQIAPTVYRPAGDLLRGHVFQGADELPPVVEDASSRDGFAIPKSMRYA